MVACRRSVRAGIPEGYQRPGSREASQPTRGPWARYCYSDVVSKCRGWQAAVSGRRWGRTAVAGQHSARRRPGATTETRGTPGRSAAIRPAAEVRAGGAKASSAEAEPQAVVVTHWFDPGAEGEPYTARLRLTGQRLGVPGRPRGRDTFSHEEVVDGVVPGSGPISVTSTVRDLEEGDWNVSGTVLKPVPVQPGRDRPGREPRLRAEPIGRAVWSWRRWRLVPAPAQPVRTRWALIAPLSRMPAVQPGSWPLLGTVGTVLALAMQVALLSGRGAPAETPLLISIGALLAGLLGAKVWYAVLHPGPWKQALLGGWSVDGFLVVAPLVAAGLLLALGQPVGDVLDATAPGMFLAVAIGRIGCLLTGCCSGQLTSGRWGVWSSDRRVGGRRVPAQQLESAAGLAIAIIAGVLFGFDVPGIPGAIFLGAVAAYLVARQLLLRVRAERREFSWRRAASGGRLP